MCQEDASDGATGMVLSDVVLSDVDVKHSEAEVSSELAVQGFETASVTRFHRTARGKPPKALPLVRVSLEEEAASRLLAAGGVHLFRVCCAAGRPKSDRDSASAKGWSADSNQHRGRKVEQAAPRTAAAAVAPLQGVPYAEQLQRKRDAMRAELAQLPALLWKEAAHVGAAQLPAWHSLGWLRAEALERHGGAPCEVEAVVASPLQEAYRNKCEFSIGADANGLPCVGFVVGTQAGVHMVCEPSDCRNVTLEMRAAAARVQAAVRASTLPPYDRKSNKGFWLQLAARQAFNCGAPPALLLVLTIKVEGWAEAEVETELRRMRAALCEPPLQPPVRLSLAVQRDKCGGASSASGEIEAVLGDPWLEEQLCGVGFRVSPGSFFQVNTRAAEVLCGVVRELCGLGQGQGQSQGQEQGQGHVLLDVCCGAGTLGLTMAAHAARIIGIEREACAVEDARDNARRNGIEHATFVAATAEAGLQTILHGLSPLERSRVVTVVDPPRAGLHPAVVKALRACPELRRLVFVSCHAPAFVQNAVGLCRPTSAGFPGAPFVVRRAAPVDLFPDTEHCELVVLLEREDVVPAAPATAAATAAAAAAAAAAATTIDDGATRDARGEEQETQSGKGGGPAPKRARLSHD